MKHIHKLFALIVATITAFAGFVLSACGSNDADATLLESSETLVVIQANTTGGSDVEIQGRGRTHL